MQEAPIERAGWTIPNWGRRYDLPRSTSYFVIKSGKGPRTTKIPGTNKTIVTVEADAEWRKQMEEGSK